MQKQIHPFIKRLSLLIVIISLSIGLLAGIAVGSNKYDGIVSSQRRELIDILNVSPGLLEEMTDDELNFIANGGLRSDGHISDKQMSALIVLKHRKNHNKIILDSATEGLTYFSIFCFPATLILMTISWLFGYGFKLHLSLR